MKFVMMETSSMEMVAQVSVRRNSAGSVLITSYVLMLRILHNGKDSVGMGKWKGTTERLVMMGT